MLVPFDAGVEVIDDFFVLKLTVFIVPAAVFIKPEYSLLLRYDNRFYFFYQSILRSERIRVILSRDAGFELRAF